MSNFDERLRAAVRAAWRVIGIAAGLLIVQWLAYLAIFATRPTWFLRMLGPDGTWPGAQALWLEGMVVFKIGLWFLVLVALWATCWRRMLPRSTT